LGYISRPNAASYKRAFFCYKTYGGQITAPTIRKGTALKATKRSTRSTAKLVEAFETELKNSNEEIAAKTASPSNNTGMTTFKKWAIGTTAVVAAVAGAVLIYRKTGQLDFEDFNKVRNSL
jgi:hypothetical protein